jgi:hypothetical protein
MPLSTNAYGVITPNQYRNAVQAASCQRAPVPSYPLTPDSFRAGLLAGLQSLAVAKGLTIDLSKIDPADLAAATKNLNEAIEASRVRFPDVQGDTFEAIVAYLLNQLLSP